MRRAFVLFGSNIEPEHNFARALALLRVRYEVTAVSPAYWTAPAGDADQPDFLNAAIELRSNEALESIHGQLRQIEALLGRRRDPERPFGPRTADLDLVLVEGVTGSFGPLTLPAPILGEQAFAAVPLAALAPELAHPTLGVSLAELARRTTATASRPPTQAETDARAEVGQRVALVTGGAVRLGRAIVEELSSAGFLVAFTYRSSIQQATELSASLQRRGTPVLALQANLDESAERASVLDAVLLQFGRLDVLVNNAAIFPRTPFAALTEGSFDAVLATNLKAPVFLTRAAAGELRYRRGCVVNIADIYGLFPLLHHLAYSVSKAALIAATKALAVELAPEVRVNAVAPGIALFPPGTDEESKQRLLRRTLLQREGGAGEIAAAVRYLVDGTATMTGQLLVIDGGRTVTL